MKTGFAASAFRRTMDLVKTVLGAAAISLMLSVPVMAQERHALIITGATGGSVYAVQYREWSEQLSGILIDLLKFEPTHIVSLSESDRPEASATAANVRRHLGSLRRSLKPDDLLFVMLIGHGTFDGLDAKFNLVGPDLESGEWAALLRGLPGRLVLVNSAAASFPFLERLAGPRRVVISATDSIAQRFDTVFPEQFVAALSDSASDIDKNGRISIGKRSRRRAPECAATISSAASSRPSVLCSTTTATGLAVSPQAQERTVPWPAVPIWTRRHPTPRRLTKFCST